MMYIPAFERFENLWPAYCRVFEDKNFTPLLAARAGVKTPPVRISCAKGCFFDSAFLPLSREEAMARLDNAGEVFIKPSVDTGSGKNCMLANIQGGKDLLSSKPLAELLAPLGMDYTVQERLRCHESIAVLYAESVNTFRLISYRWKDEILFMPTILRIGSGGKHIDNAHAGGFFVGVLEDGKLTRSAFTEFRTEYERHPDTGICFAEHRIPLYPEVKAAARRMHEILPQIGVVNWDFTLDESGAPVLIEMNVLGGSPWMAEMAHGCGPFGDKLPEILRWLRLMENTKAADREQYAFGRGV